MKYRLGLCGIDDEGSYTSNNRYVDLTDSQVDKLLGLISEKETVSGSKPVDKKKKLQEKKDE